VGPLSDDLARDDARPYFIWDVEITISELRRLLRHPDPRARALWIARVMREARYPDVWRLLSLDEILASYPLARRHLGRRRAFWDFLLDGWKADGLVAGGP
jgi:hypothetical protein